MKRPVTIIKIGETRKGISQRTGQEWERTDVEVTWTDHGQNGEEFDQAMVVQLNGKLNEDRFKVAISQRETVEARIYFSLSASNGRSFNNIRAYLPNDFYEGRTA